MNKIIKYLIIGLIIIGVGFFLYSLQGTENAMNDDTITSADDAPAGSIHNLPVPDAVAKVRTHASTEFDVREGVVTIMTAYEKEWTDSCLGLGGPAESCLQVITPGWEVSLEVNGTEYTYRTNIDGSVIRKAE